MSSTFLHAVAHDIRRRYSSHLDHLTIVLPNKRAALFLEHALMQDIEAPTWSPRYITIDQLFRSLTNLRIADDIALVIQLHQCFVQCTGKQESLDEFFGWGQLLLADFDDIDKHMADARQLFSNVRDLHELDTIDYLSDEQKQHIARFFSNFTDNHESKLRDNFIRLWSHLADIYELFHNRLLQQGLAYEGMLFRHVCEQHNDNSELLNHNLSSDTHFLFVGFNLLSPVEKHIFQFIKQHYTTLFYWDYDTYYINNGHEAGEYIRENKLIFPNALPDNDEQIYDNFCKKKSIQLISGSTETVLARYTAHWLEHLKPEEIRQTPPNTAIVLCNQALLSTVIHSMPADIGDVNITTGYPLSHTPVSSLLHHLMALCHFGLSSNGKRLRYKYIAPLLQHPLMQHISTNTLTLANNLNSNHRYYPFIEEVCIDEGLTCVFGQIPVLKDNKQDESTDITILATLSEWIVNIVEHIAIAVETSTINDALTPETLFRTYTLLNRLHSLITSGQLAITTDTYERLIQYLIGQTTIPFHGEPAQGIQVMGMLDTRNLDFDNLLILSCGEDYLPQLGITNSFIPYSIREAYGLTTHYHKEKMQAYYFYRLLQRAKNITLAYCSTANSTSSGEKSRYILQLLTESPHNIQSFTLSTDVHSKSFKPKSIAKTQKMLTALEQRQHFSPTAINTYIKCPLRFCYQYILNLTEKENISEDDIDQRAFGNLFHDIVRQLYADYEDKHIPVTANDIRRLLNDKENIRTIIDNAFQYVLNGGQHLSEDNRVSYNGTQLIIKQVLFRYATQLLEIDLRYAPFYILGLEKKVSMPFTFASKGHNTTTRLEGTIDRLDAKVDNNGNIHIRIIDYKTGYEDKSKVSSIDALFLPDNSHSTKSHYLQTILYSIIVDHLVANGTLSLPECGSGKRLISPHLLYIRNNYQHSDESILQVANNPITDISTIEEPFTSLLADTFAAMFNAEKPFRYNGKTDKCDQCPHYKFCRINSETDF